MPTKDELTAKEAEAWAGFEELLAAVPEERLETPAFDGGWSVKDVLWHVAYWWDDMTRAANSGWADDGEDHTDSRHDPDSRRTRHDSMSSAGCVRMHVARVVVSAAHRPPWLAGRQRDAIISPSRLPKPEHGAAQLPVDELRGVHIGIDAPAADQADERVDRYRRRAALRTNVRCGERARRDAERSRRIA